MYCLRDIRNEILLERSNALAGSWKKVKRAPGENNFPQLRRAM